MATAEPPLETAGSDTEDLDGAVPALYCIQYMQLSQSLSCLSAAGQRNLQFADRA